MERAKYREDPNHYYNDRVSTGRSCYQDFTGMDRAHIHHRRRYVNRVRIRFLVIHVVGAFQGVRISPRSAGEQFAVK